MLGVLENQNHSESKQEDEYNKQEDISTKTTNKDITSSSNYSRYQYTKENLEKFLPLNLNNIGYPIILISSNCSKFASFLYMTL